MREGTVQPAASKYRLAPGLWLAWALGIALGCVAVHPSQLLEHHLVRIRVKIEVLVLVRVRVRFRVRVGDSGWRTGRAGGPGP